MIVAFSAVGSLREEISPGSFVLPNQIIDRTKGVRPASFFEGTTVVAHAQFGDPFSNKLVEWLGERVKKALDSEAKGVKLFTGKCIVCMEGPQFSTRAESIMYRQWGGDLINMSVLPEAKLAREAEIRCVVSPSRLAHRCAHILELAFVVMPSSRQRQTTTLGDPTRRRLQRQKFSKP